MERVRTKARAWSRATGTVLLRVFKPIASRLKILFRLHYPPLAVGLIILLLLVVYFWEAIFITVHSGEAGILYHRFGNGTVVDRIYTEGFHVIAPWNIMTVYDIRYQTKAHQMEAITSKGLKVKINLAVRYHPEVLVLGALHQEVGPDYLQKIIIPEVESALRMILGRYDTEEIYSSKKGIIQEILNESLEQVSQRFVKIDNVMITNIELPRTIKDAVETKLEQQQLAESYVFKIQREEQEAERKKIEAAGIRTYHGLIDSSLNEKLIRWKGVEATREIAKSPNAKVVIIGAGKSGMPMIIDAK